MQGGKICDRNRAICPRVADLRGYTKCGFSNSNLSNSQAVFTHQCLPLQSLEYPQHLFILFQLLFLPVLGPCFSSYFQLHLLSVFQGFIVIPDILRVLVLILQTSYSLFSFLNKIFKKIQMYFRQEQHLVIFLVCFLICITFINRFINSKYATECFY